MKIQGAIFDMDGTLLDSMPVWSDAGDIYLLRRGIEPPPDLYDKLRSMSMTQTAQYLIGRFMLRESVPEVIDGVNGCVRERYCAGVPVKPGVAATLEALKHTGARLCVATATDRPLAEAALRRAGLWDSFVFMLTCTEEGAGKDRPEIFLRAAALLGTSPERTAVFEDSLYAVETAKAAGFYVVAVADEASAGDEAAIRAAADVFVRRMDEWKPV